MVNVRLLKGEQLKNVTKEKETRQKVESIDRVLELLPSSIACLIYKLPDDIKESLEEIRLRVERPLQVRWSTGDGWLTQEGEISEEPLLAYKVTESDLKQTIQVLTKSSFYALEEELRSGYITISGGHRVGLVGEAVVFQGEIKTIKNISGLNLRLAKSVEGCARDIMPYLWEQGRPLHTLILSPPRCGKTTLLRDIVRFFSTGVPEQKIRGLAVGIVDERSEIAGCWLGVPQLAVGPRTDVLDRCPKAAGMIMLLRSMGPEIIATDEVGKQEELAAVMDALNAGVTVLASVHAKSLEELERRPGWRNMLAQGVWQRVIVLGRSLGPGTVDNIYDGDGRIILNGPWRGRWEKC